MFTNLENFLANLCFVTLLFSVIFYWIQTSNIVGATAETHNIIWAPQFSKLFSKKMHKKGLPPNINMPFHIEELNSEKSSVNNLGEKSLINRGLSREFGTIGIFFSNICLMVLLLLRWKESGHFPLSNLYESLMFLSWSFTTIHLFIETKIYQLYNFSYFTNAPAPEKMSGEEQSSTSYKKVAEQFSNHMYDVGGVFSPPAFAPRLNLGALTPPALASSSLASPILLNRELENKHLLYKKKQFIIGKFVACITSPSALFTNAFATLSLPKEMQGAAPLVPALQSNWLMMHVTVMILSYAALILGSLLSIAFLIITKRDPRKKTSEATVKISHNHSENKASSGQNDSLQKLAKTLDNLSYRILGIGFPLLTIGILSGAVWANEAWGSYWSWDPKETWALLTWLVFAIYLHTRLTKAWEGEKPAMIASLGFVTVWICFLGVNLIGEGLHSYGWIVKS